jgi:hypothetical protein
MSTYWANINNEYSGTEHEGSELDPFSFADLLLHSANNPSGNVYNIQGSYEDNSSSYEYSVDLNINQNIWQGVNLPVNGPWRVALTGRGYYLTINLHCVEGGECRDAILYMSSDRPGCEITVSQNSLVFNTYIVKNNNLSFNVFTNSFFKGCTILCDIYNRSSTDVPLPVFIDCLVQGITNGGGGAIYNNCAIGYAPESTEDVTNYYNNCQIGWILPEFPAYNAPREDFNSEILCENVTTPPLPGAGSPSFTGYETGLWGSLRTGIGAVDFVGAPPPPIVPLIISTTPVTTKSVLTKQGLIDFKINTVDNVDGSSGLENDFAKENFDLVLIDGKEQIRQRLKIRLQFFSGEWYLDTMLGVRFYQDVLIKNPQLTKLQSLFKATIMGTVGVTRLVAFDLTVDNQNRSMALTFTVDTLYGIITAQENL